VEEGMEARFEQFIRERQYLANVTPATIDWYKNSLKWLRTVSPSQDDLKDAVIRMRSKGLKPTGCNSAIQALNSYAHWSTRDQTQSAEVDAVTRKSPT
jgi:integrase/recombinase XerD